MAKTAAENAYELGKKYEKEYKGCSQCVIAALQDAFDIRNDDIFKSATALAGGGCRLTDGSCGAYVGGIMVLGYLVGRERDNFSDPEGIRYKTADLAKKLHDKYIQEYGSVICRDVHGKLMGRPFYIADPDEFEKFEQAGAHEVHCLEVVGKAARWVAEIIEEEKLL
jgi:C_GCAxxG_C_C family probable redox protein